MFPGEAVKRDPRRMSKYRNELKEYFTGKRKKFSFKVDLDWVKSPFQRRVLRMCGKIPFGQVMSYGALAKKAGSPGAARAVGGSMRINPVPIVIPCHRVVASSGGLGGYTGGLVFKKILITHEGRTIKGKRIDK